MDWLIWLLPPMAVLLRLVYVFKSRRIIRTVVWAAVLLFTALCLVQGAHYTGVLLFLAGAVLLAAETLIPGFGPLGVMGLLFLLGGGYFCTQGSMFVLRLGTAAAPFLLYPWLKKIWGAPTWVAARFVNDHSARIIPATPLLGQQWVHCKGISLTALRPGGLAMVNGQRVEVISEDGFLAAQKPIEVVAVRNGKLVVRAGEPGD